MIFRRGSTSVCVLSHSRFPGEPIFAPKRISSMQMTEVNNSACSASNRISTSGLGLRRINSLRRFVSSRYMPHSNSGAGGPRARCRSSSISSKILKIGSSFGMPFGLKKLPSGRRCKLRLNGLGVPVLANSAQIVCCSSGGRLLTNSSIFSAIVLTSQNLAPISGNRKQQTPSKAAAKGGWTAETINRTRTCKLAAEQFIVRSGPL